MTVKPLPNDPPKGFDVLAASKVTQQQELISELQSDLVKERDARKEDRFVFLVLIVILLDIDAVLLDNFSPDDLRTGVQRVREAERAGGRRILVEASGGIRPETAAAIAATGVDLLSIGRLTNSSPNLDVALDIDTASPASTV